MVLSCQLRRDVKKIEGRQFALRAPKNSQDSVRITDEAAVPKCHCEVRKPAAICDEMETNPTPGSP
jgi:hypothetical protein